MMAGHSSSLRELMVTTSALSEQLMRAVEKLQSDEEGKQIQASSHACNSHAVTRNDNGCGHGAGSNTSGCTDGGTSSTLSGFCNIQNKPRFNYWNPMNTLAGKRKGGVKLPSKPAKKKAKVPTWTHTFVCLAFTDQDLIPESSERAWLHLAGLGEKKIQLSIDSDAHSIHSELFSQFPKLSNGGGYELLRAEKGQKLLCVIDAPASGYTASYLKAVAHNAKIYVRPLQRDLSLDAENKEEVQLVLCLCILHTLFSFI